MFAWKNFKHQFHNQTNQFWQLLAIMFLLKLRNLLKYLQLHKKKRLLMFVIDPDVLIAYFSEGFYCHMGYVQNSLVLNKKHFYLCLSLVKSLKGRPHQELTLRYDYISFSKCYDIWQTPKANQNPSEFSGCDFKISPVSPIQHSKRQCRDIQKICYS